MTSGWFIFGVVMPAIVAGTGVALRLGAPALAAPAGRKAQRAPPNSLAALAPARQQVPRRRPGRPDGAGDGPRQAVRRRVASTIASSSGRAAGCRRPVETAKTRSPSKGVCAGWIARTSPACAASASRRAPALSSATSVATMAIVVLRRARPGLQRPRREGRAPAPRSARGRRTRRRSRTPRPRTRGRPARRRCRRR